MQSWAIACLQEEYSFYLSYPFSIRHLEKQTDATLVEAVKQKYIPKSTVKKMASDTLKALILPCRKLEKEEKTAALLCTKAPHVR